MAVNRYSNVYQFKKPQQQPDLALENFLKWVAIKNQALEAAAKNQFTNKIKLELSPKPNLALPKPTNKPTNSHFFSPYQIKPNNPQFKPADQLKKALEEKQKLEKQLALSLGCNNCGSVDHNSLSCVKPTGGPKR